MTKKEWSHKYQARLIEKVVDGERADTFQKDQF
jgi:hypothetical protein